MQIAHDKGQRPLKKLGQRPGKVLGVEIVGGVDLISRVTDRLDHELRYDPFRLLGKQQHPGQVQPTVVGGQVHVLQQPGQLVGGTGVLLFVDIAQKIAKAQLVQLVDPLGHGQHDDDAAVLQCHVFGLHRQRATHQMAGRIADELVDTGHILP